MAIEFINRHCFRRVSKKFIYFDFLQYNVFFELKHRIKWKIDLKKKEQNQQH